MIYFYAFVIVSVTVFIPLPSNQHFIWPIEWCVLAEICNHTWIPECGLERDEDYYRLFLDECDMFEYNCDNGLNFEIRNYSECFNQRGPCPPVRPCPSVPPCPNHAYHRMNEHYIYPRRYVSPRPTIRTSRTPPPNLPYHMLHGKRRYTPDKPKRRHRDHDYPPHVVKLLSEAEKYNQQLEQNRLTTQAMKKPKMTTKQMRLKPRRTSATWKTKIIKTSTFMKNGKRMVKIVRGINLAYTKTTDNSDFLE